MPVSSGSPFQGRDVVCREVERVESCCFISRTLELLPLILPRGSCRRRWLQWRTRPCRSCPKDMSLSYLLRPLSFVLSITSTFDVQRSRYLFRAGSRRPGNQKSCPKDMSLSYLDRKIRRTSHAGRCARQRNNQTFHTLHHLFHTRSFTITSSGLRLCSRLGLRGISSLRNRNLKPNLNRLRKLPSRLFPLCGRGALPIS